MTDDESHVDPKSVAQTDHFGQALLYDYAKFLTTLSLLALGGVLTLTQTAEPKEMKKAVIAFVLGAIALAGIAAVSAAGAMVEAQSGGRQPRISARTQIKIATALLGVGAGGFLMMWWKTL